MRQGEIWQAYFDPIKGSEQGGNRPAVIISGNTLNSNLNVVVACPLTSKVKHYKGNPVLKPNPKNGLSATSEIMVLHVRSISKLRLKHKVGVISKDELNQIKNTLNDILKY